MRILYLHRTQGEEPESIHILAIVEALRALGHEVQVVGPVDVGHPRGADPPPSALAKIKRRLPRLVVELLQIGYNLAAYWKLRRAARAFRPDLIYERYALYGFVGVAYARAHKIPLVLEVNTLYARAWIEYYGLYLRRVATGIEKWTLQNADHIITVSTVQQLLLESSGIPGGRITVCHNAIDPEWFNPERHADPDLRRRLGLSGVVIGFVGTMNRWQGVLEFSKVFEAVFKECPDTSFLFVGDGEFRGQLEQFCRDQKFSQRVVFTGRKPHAEIPPLVASMDVTVLLNSNEYGSPMKIFEYWAMGKAVIAPSVPPVVEVLVDGETGILIKPGDAAQMAVRIVALAKDAALRRRLGDAGRAYVNAHHTWRQNASAIIDAYGTLSRDG